MKQATLCLFIRENKGEKELLLGMKKRGFGVGKWNGFGGKSEKDESIEESAIREIKEEIGVQVKGLEKVAVFNFFFPYISDKKWDQKVHVFLVKKWEGEPTESEEMMPKWFSVKELPFEKMWDDDKIWLPLVLEGKN